MWEDPCFVQVEGQWVAFAGDDVIAQGTMYEDVLGAALAIIEPAYGISCEESIFRKPFRKSSYFLPGDRFCASI